MSMCLRYFDYRNIPDVCVFETKPGLILDVDIQELHAVLDAILGLN